MPSPTPLPGMGTRLLQGLGQGLNWAGNQIRYGVSPEEKYRMVLAQPGYKDSDEAAKTEAERRVSTALATKRWGPLPPFLFNTAREATQGAGALLSGKPFFSTESTPGDESLTSGYNPQSILTGLEASTEVDPKLALLRRLLTPATQTASNKQR